MLIRDIHLLVILVQFEVGGLYRILPMMRSSPNMPEELVDVLYDPDGRNRGFMHGRRARAEIVEALAQATYVYCRVQQRGRRWNSLDSSNDSYWEFQKGIVDWWTTEEEEEEDWISTASGSEEEDNSRDTVTTYLNCMMPSDDS
ncbi:hypothetical protein E4U09_003920 [Claviceps aff. purpurea]|uniref:Uncharacterized protein n=1 Tax=Claviceps aff. purpurea TaxID=1967640 RepID=A0A9P7QG42_9HYPO|nr:hypothetical protein E4U09_003920 [Claviceps aff. purpurea]